MEPLYLDWTTGEKFEMREIKWYKIGTKLEHKLDWEAAYLQPANSQTRNFCLLAGREEQSLELAEQNKMKLEQNNSINFASKFVIR